MSGSARISSLWQQQRPGRDRRAERIPAAPGLPTADQKQRRHRVVVIGGGIAGLAAATALTERGVQVVLVEREAQLGGRVRAWPLGTDGRTMSRGFHAFFRQYYNLRRLLQRTSPELAQLRPVHDYPLRHADGHQDSFRRVARTPPWNLLSFVATSPSFGWRNLGRINIDAALSLLDVDFPATFEQYDGLSASAHLDQLGFPDRARHLALEVFARSFFSDPDDFSAGELVAMFHSYFIGSAEGLLFDVPVDDYDTSLWSPLGEHLRRGGADLQLATTATGLDLSGPDVQVTVRRNSGPEHLITADALVLATDLPGLAQLVTDASPGVSPDWRSQLSSQPIAPAFAVWRLWLDRRVAADRPAFLGTSGHARLDNVSMVHRFEAGASAWAARHGGAVVELHAYALPEPTVSDRGRLRRELLDDLHQVCPETVEATIVAEEFRVDRDCPAFPPGQRGARPQLQTPDPRVVMAGDAVACDLPVALMERAATTGFQAANALLHRWGVRGHDLWTVPRRGRHSWPHHVRTLLTRSRPQS